VTIGTGGEGDGSGGGIQPVAVDYRGTYNNGDGTYAVGSVVLFNGLLYKKISNPGNSGYPSVGADWQLFEPLIGSPAYDLWVQTMFDWPSNPLLDASGNPSVDFYNRKLLGFNTDEGESRTSLDWDNCYLKSIYTGNTTVYWSEGTLFDYSSALAVDWNSRRLIDTYNSITVDWRYQRLMSDEVDCVAWGARVLYDVDGFQMLNWGTGEVNDSLHDATLNWYSRFLYKQWTTIATGKTAGNVMSNATYLSTTTLGGTYNPPSAPAQAGMVIYHQSASSALITSMTLELYGATSALDSVPVGGDISFTSRWGVTGLSVTYGSSYTLLGTPVTTCAAGATITWRKLSSAILARLT
jgi:hypothetical protein